MTNSRIPSVYAPSCSIRRETPRGYSTSNLVMATGAVTEGELSESELQQEHEHFQKIVNAFLYYKTHALSRVDRFSRNYQGLPLHHRKMLPGIPSHIQALKSAIDVNQCFVEMIVASAVGMFENSQISQLDAGMMTVTPAASFDMEKVRTTIKQFFRDWSEEGAAERDLCYKPIIDEIVSRYPPDQIDAGRVSILVPGAGLGRLAFELAQRGYTCQGNEFSMFMLLASNFILNQTSGVKAFTICPWIHQFSNTWSYDDQLAKISIPDVNPCDLPTFGLFSMAAGDFLEVYNKPDEWDCVACCFFIDTAHNVIQYLEKIYHILKPGGVWINFAFSSFRMNTQREGLGDRLYHFGSVHQDLGGANQIAEHKTKHCGGSRLVSRLANSDATFMGPKAELTKFPVYRHKGFNLHTGPLLYHFADMPGEPSIELSWQDIRRIAEEEIGFEIIREDRHLPSTYIQNPHSMFKMMYSCVFLVARKPTTDHGAQQAGGDDPLPELQTVEPAADSTMSCTIALETQSTDLTIQSVTGTTTQS